MAKEKESKKAPAVTEKEGAVQRVEPSRALSPFDEMERAMENMDRILKMACWNLPCLSWRKQNGTVLKFPDAWL